MAVAAQESFGMKKNRCYFSRFIRSRVTHHHDNHDDMCIIFLVAILQDH